MFSDLPEVAPSNPMVAASLIVFVLFCVLRLVLHAYRITRTKKLPHTPFFEKCRTQYFVNRASQKCRTRMQARPLGQVSQQLMCELLLDRLQHLMLPARRPYKKHALAKAQGKLTSFLGSLRHLKLTLLGGLEDNKICNQRIRKHVLAKAQGKLTSSFLGSLRHFKLPPSRRFGRQQNALNV